MTAASLVAGASPCKEAEQIAGKTKIELSEEQTQEYVDLCLKRGEAPIKLSYLGCVANPEKYHTAGPLKEVLTKAGQGDLCSSEKGKRALDSENDGSSPAAKRTRGQNRDRDSNRHAERAAFAAPRLCCTAAATNADCEDPRCTKEHDRKIFLESQKKKRLSGICPNITAFDVCRFGAACLFSESHTNADGYNLDSNGEVVSAESFNKTKEKRREINDISHDTRKALLDKTYKFPKRDIDAGYTGPTSNPLMDDDGSSASAAGEGPVIEDQKDSLNHRQARKNEIFKSGKLMLAPLTTLGNMPFRRLCISYGAEVTMSEMALARSVISGKPNELALLKRHPEEKYFGVQIASGQVGDAADCASFLASAEVQCDFVDLNAACPLDGLHRMCAGSVLLERGKLLPRIVGAMKAGLHAAEQNLPETLKSVRHPTLLTCKMRLGQEKATAAQGLIPLLEEVGVDAVFVHGRTGKQRYSKLADWDMLQTLRDTCSSAAFIGNGDILSWEHYQRHMQQADNVLIGRGALIKPWIFTEIKEQRLWDISAQERLDLMKKFVSYGFTHWGTDDKGVETTRRYFLEMCSFSHRYIPVGLLERVPQAVNWRCPPIVGRNALETLLASDNVTDWIQLSEMLIAPVPDNFTFIPKHRANAY